MIQTQHMLQNTAFAEKGWHGSEPLTLLSRVHASVTGVATVALKWIFWPLRNQCCLVCE